MGPDLETALASGDLSLLVWTAAAMGFLHTILGPDHYLPFVMLSRANRWTHRKTLTVTALCGVGHVGSSMLLGGFLAAAGMALAQWEGSSWAALHASRGSISAWLLIGVGVAMGVWGLVQVSRGRTHTHAHVHEDGTLHAHGHGHRDGHAHAHASRTAGEGAPPPLRRATPWVLFVIFVFGPCESLIPLLLVAFGTAGLGGAALVGAAFSLTTLVTILGAVGALLLGLQRLPLARFDRWSTAVAGFSLVLCGAGIAFLGL